MKLRWPTTILVVAFAACAHAAPEPEAPADLAGAMAWSLLPGGGHFYLDEDLEGSLYAGSTLAFAGAGFWLDQHERDDENRNDEDDEEVNTWWLLAEKSWELSLFTTYRSALTADGSRPEDHGVDDISVPQMFAAPFRGENIRDPMVWLAGVLGIALAAVDAHGADHSFDDVRDVHILGADANQEWGLAAYSADAFSLSLAAGVAEEGVWRGILQNEFEASMGERGGLWATAGLFGAAHLVDLNGDLSGERVAAASLGGLYLGSLYQRGDHRLAKPIAAHFWYNFTLMLTSFALNPDDNPLGVRVGFQY